MHFIIFYRKLKEEFKWNNLNKDVIKDFNTLTGSILSMDTAEYISHNSDIIRNHFTVNPTLAFSLKYFGKLIGAGSVFTHHLQPGQTFENGSFSGNNHDTLQQMYNEQAKLKPELDLILTFMSKVVNDKLLADMFINMKNTKDTLLKNKPSTMKFIETHLINNYDIIGLQEINGDLHGALKTKTFDNYKLFMQDNPPADKKTCGGILIRNSQLKQ